MSDEVTRKFVPIYEMQERPLTDDYVPVVLETELIAALVRVECAEVHAACLRDLVADHEEVHEDHHRLVMELDVLLNGAGAARQASLVDIVAQLAIIHRRTGRPILEWMS